MHFKCEAHPHIHTRVHTREYVSESAHVSATAAAAAYVHLHRQAAFYPQSARQL